MGLLGSTEGSFFLPFPLDPQFWGTIQAADHHFRVCSEHPPSGRGFLLSKMAQPLGGWGALFSLLSLPLHFSSFSTFCAQRLVLKSGAQDSLSKSVAQKTECILMSPCFPS